MSYDVNGNANTHEDEMRTERQAGIVLKKCPPTVDTKVDYA